MQWFLIGIYNDCNKYNNLWDIRNDFSHLSNDFLGVISNSYSLYAIIYYQFLQQLWLFKQRYSETFDGDFYVLHSGYSYLNNNFLKIVVILLFIVGNGFLYLANDTYLFRQYFYQISW